MPDESKNLKAISEYILLYYAPVILVIGLLGNCISGYVFRQPIFCRRPSTLYFVLLAVFDNATLFLGLGRHVLKTYSSFDVRNIHSLTCSLHRVIVYSAMNVCSWILVASSLERTLVSFFPTRISMSKKQTQWICWAIIVLAFLLNSWILFLYHLFPSAIYLKNSGVINRTVDFINLQEMSDRSFQNFSAEVELTTPEFELNNSTVLTNHPRKLGLHNQSIRFDLIKTQLEPKNQTSLKNHPADFDPSKSKTKKKTRLRCGFKNLYSVIYFGNKIRPWTDAVLYSLLPFWVMLVCNILLIRRLSKWSIYQNRNSKPNSADNFEVDKNDFEPDKEPLNVNGGASGNCVEDCESTIGNKPPELKTRPSQGGTRANLERKMTVLSVSVCMIYLLLTFPDMLFSMVFPVYEKWLGNRTDWKQIDNLTDDVTDMLKYTNSAVNFFVYLSTNSNFRKEVSMCFHCRRKDRIEHKTSAIASLVASGHRDAVMFELHNELYEN